MFDRKTSLVSEVAPPGDLQGTIDTVAPSTGVGTSGTYAAVEADPTQTYDLDSEITVKPGVILNMNGARVTHTGDHNLFFLDNNAHLRGLNAYVDGSSFSSDVVVRDTSRSVQGKYSIGPADSAVNTVATVQARAFETSGTPGGTLLADRDDGAEGISFANNSDLVAFRLDNGYLADVPTGGFVNQSRNFGSFTDCTTALNHTGSDVARSIWYGEIQHGANTDFGIRNQSSASGTIGFYGYIADPADANTASLAGGNITVWDQRQSNVTNYPGTTDGSNDMTVIGLSQTNELQVYESTGDVAHQFRFKNGTYTYVNGGTNIFRIFDNGNARLQQDGAQLEFGTGGARIQEDASGNLEAVNDDGTSGDIV